MTTQLRANTERREGSENDSERDSYVLYLISSNWTRKYLSDAVKVLSLPRDYVFHFRYEANRWVDSELLEKLPKPGEKIPSELEDIDVAVLYLQQVDGDPPEWKGLYPLRRAVLEECFIDGSIDSGIAHFYFRLGSYLRPIENEPLGTLKEAAYRDGSYAFLYQEIEEVVPEGEDDHAAYIDLVDELNPSSLVDKDGRQYVIPFFRIDGLATEGEDQKPEWDGVTRRSVYEFRETMENSLTLKTYFSGTLDNGGLRPDFSIAIETDPHMFSTPERYEMAVESRYDQESYSIIPRLLDSDSYTNIMMALTQNSS